MASALRSVLEPTVSLMGLSPARSATGLMTTYHRTLPYLAPFALGLVTLRDGSKPCDHVGMSQKVNHERDKDRREKDFCTLERASLLTYRLRELRAS